MKHLTYTVMVHSGEAVLSVDNGGKIPVQAGDSIDINVHVELGLNLLGKLLTKFGAHVSTDVHFSKTPITNSGFDYGWNCWVSDDKSKPQSGSKGSE